jgi:hypothetical protein
MNIMIGNNDKGLPPITTAATNTTLDDPTRSPGREHHHYESTDGPFLVLMSENLDEMFRE